MNVRTVYDLIHAVAPFDTQMEGANSGLLVGSPQQEVKNILFALDVTEPVIDEAAALGADLIVTHHPLMFDPLRTLTEADYEARLIRRLVRENISLIAAHTNLDQARGGVNDALAECCGLTDICGEGFFRCGMLSSPCTADQFADRLRACLHTDVRMMGPGDAVIRKIGLCSGGGSDEWHTAAAAGCDAFISGEIKHHFALALADAGLIGFECGHYATEEPGVRALAAALQKQINQVECKMRIYVSDVSAYSFSRKP